MLVNLKLLCSRYLYDVLVDQPYENTLRCAETYGGLEHGLVLLVDNFLIPCNFYNFRLFTYVRGDKHGNYYSYPSKVPLSDIISSNYMQYGYFKKNIQHGVWKIVYSDKSHEDVHYKNGRVLKILYFDNRGVINMMTIYKHGTVFKHTTFHKNGLIKLSECYMEHGRIKCVEYDEQGRQI